MEIRTERRIHTDGGLGSLSRVNLGPMIITNTDMAGALKVLESAIGEGKPHSFCFCEANLLSNALGSKELRLALRRFSAVFPDGIALATLLKMHGAVPRGRVTGPSFMLAACEYGVARQWRHFFCGGSPGVAEKLAENLCAKYPGLQVAGVCSPPFRPMTPAEELQLKQSIESAKTDLLWVGLGSPKQEFWVAQHLGLIHVPVMLAVGAAFDFHSGNRPWAPPIIRRLGVEWIFRMCTGGSKTFVRNIKCVSRVAAYLGIEAVRCSLRRMKKKS